MWGAKNTYSTDAYNNHIENEISYFESELRKSSPKSKIKIKWNNDNMASKLYIDKTLSKFYLEESKAKLKK